MSLNSTIHRCFIAFISLISAVAVANEPAIKSTIALVGDADRFNIAQDGFCGKRTEIPQAANIRFQVPALLKTYFFIRSNFRVPTGNYYCESDYSFIPEPGKLHIIRHAFEGSKCRLEMYSSTPGETPQAMQFEQEAQRSCLLP